MHAAPCTPPLRYYADNMFYREPNHSSASSKAEVGQDPNVVRDPRLGEFRVWRPVEAPPLPRHFTQRSPPAADAGASQQQRALQSASLYTTPPRATYSDEESDDHQHHYQHQEQQQTSRAPPRGQLLPRGKGGLDDVLKNAREAQSLFYDLQERRLKAEYRSHQRELKAELDQQRHCKRMADLAAYQEELVNIYGPTMRDVITDVFFDDGHDPVVALLKAKRAAPVTQHSDVVGGRLVSSDSQHAARPQLWQPVRSAECDTVASPRDQICREREQLQRALVERRSGQRTNY